MTLKSDERIRKSSSFSADEELNKERTKVIENLIEDIKKEAAINDRGRKPGTVAIGNCPKCTKDLPDYSVQYCPYCKYDFNLGAVWMERALKAEAEVERLKALVEAAEYTIDNYVKNYREGDYDY